MITRESLPLARRRFLGSAATLLAGAGMGAFAGFAPGRALADAALAAPPPALRFPAVAQLLDRYATPARLPGLLASIGFGTAEPAFVARGTGAFGATRPLDGDSLFRVYSMTKPITGMAAMILIDAGKLGLDQPVADILPAYAHLQVLVDPEGPVDHVEPAKAPITIRHLLTHTSGLGYTIVQNGPIKALYEAHGLVPAQISRLPLPGLNWTTSLPSLAAFADELAKVPLVYQPGTKWSYSVGLDLLGRVIEVVSGQPFDQFLSEHIFGPAGMTSTWFQVPASAAGRLTSNYGVRDEHVVEIDPGERSIYLDRPAFPFGGAGLVSSPRDYDRFLAMLANAGLSGTTRVMTASAVRLGVSNLLPPGISLSGTWIAGSGFGAGGRVGLGAEVGTFGWSGAAGTIGFINTRNRLRAGLFCQYMPSTTWPLGTEFPAALLRDLVPPKAQAAA